MKIAITRVDAGLHLAPAPEYLTKYLKYTHRSMKTVNFRKAITFEERLLHHPDGDGGVFTLQGFFTEACRLIHKNKDTFNVIDMRTPMPEIDWQAIKDIGPRDYQVDSLVEGLNKGFDSSGIFNATGGYGKTFIQAFTYAAWNELNTILAIPIAQVFEQTYNKFVKIFPHKHVGRVGGGHMDISKDITITTFRSLDKCAVEKCELLLIDELQSTTGDKIQDTITSIKPRRIFGYTATDNGMFSGTEKVIKGIFGERLIHIPYDEAVEVGAVVPGLVYMIKTPQCLVTAKEMDYVMAQGIKRNKSRNELIAKVCANVPKGWATLTFIDHVQDHLPELYKYMPKGTKFVHREASKTKIGQFALTAKQQKEVVNGFTNNEFQHLIASDAFRAGVDIPHLRVVVQASGGASKIEVIQEALRGSRTLPDERKAELGITEDKTHFVVIDCMDNHDERLENMARKRMQFYEQEGWKVKIVDSVADIDWYDYEEAKL